MAYRPDTTLINELLRDCGIEVGRLLDNTKASESYVVVTFTQDDGFKKMTVIPYVYRRSQLSIDSDEALSDHLKLLKPYFTEKSMAEWRDREWSKWTRRVNQSKRPEELVTIHFFEKLLTFDIVTEFPVNPNPQRRIQSIKDEGYTVCRFQLEKSTKWGTILLPTPLTPPMKYESIPTQLKGRIIRVLKGINAFEAKRTPTKALIPDHKFSEVRWDEHTPVDNPEEMSDQEIIDKFQLLDNQRNQQKREICRNCKQTSIRGKIYGIDFYASGGAFWEKGIPQTGRAAEKGCKGCPWYDIDAWRKALNAKLGELK